MVYVPMQIFWVGLLTDIRGSQGHSLLKLANQVCGSVLGPEDTVLLRPYGAKKFQGCLPNIGGPSGYC